MDTVTKEWIDEIESLSSLMTAPGAVDLLSKGLSEDEIRELFQTDTGRKAAIIIGMTRKVLTACMKETLEAAKRYAEAVEKEGQALDQANAALKAQLIALKRMSAADIAAYKAILERNEALNTLNGSVYPLSLQIAKAGNA